MSRRGNCYDNAVMESWFSTVKSEAGERFESYAHAKEALFDYIKAFHNRRRRHSTLGQISPAAFARKAAMDAAGAVDAQNAPTAPWTTAENAVSHSTHSPSSVFIEERQNEARSTQSTRPQNRIRPKEPHITIPGGAGTTCS